MILDTSVRKLPKGKMTVKKFEKMGQVKVLSVNDKTPKPETLIRIGDSISFKGKDIIRARMLI